MPKYRRKNSQIVNDLNILLKNNVVKVISIDKDNIVLSDGFYAKKQEFLSFCKSKYLFSYIDEYFSENTSLERKKEIKTTVKKIYSSLGGKKAGQINLLKYGPLNKGISWNKNKKMKELIPDYKHWAEGHTKQTHSSLLKISNERKGENNPVYRQTEETKKLTKIKQSNTMKLKILNGEFTPKTKNSRTHWNSSVLCNFFRSSWEAIFWYKNQHLLYEKKRIEYFDTTTNKIRVYIADFFDESTNTVYEIKPLSLLDKFKDKKSATEKLFNLKIITENDIILLVNEMFEDEWGVFDDKTKFLLKGLKKNEIDKHTRN